MDKLRIFNVKWTSYSAGPSSDNNRRTEIFLAGCKKACSGNPCPDCFNKELWDRDNYCALVTPQEAYEQIRKFARNKFITFVGGEPLDQIEPLADLVELLAQNNYDVIVITHFSWEEIFDKAVSSRNSPYRKLAKNVSIIIDGEYDKNQRIWDDSKAGDGLHDVIGSGNQCIIDLNLFNNFQPYIFPAKILDGWKMDSNRNYQYIRREER